MTIIMFATLSYQGLCAFVLVLFNITSFLFKSRSNDYICPLTKRIELGCSSIILWMALSFCSLILPNLRIDKLNRVFMISFFFLIFSILFKKKNSKEIELIGQNQDEILCEEKCLKRLETLIWLYSSMDVNKNDYYKKIFFGYLAERSFEKEITEEVSSPLLSNSGSGKSRNNFRSLKVRQLTSMSSNSSPKKRRSRSFFPNLAKKMNFNTTVSRTSSTANTISGMVEQEIDNLPQNISVEFIQALKR